MRLVSTLETIRNREVSVLAVAETLVAMAGSAFIYVQFDTLKHIAVSACIVPFLLLRPGRRFRDIGAGYTRH